MIGLWARYCVSLMLLGSALGKLASLQRFVIVIEEFKLCPDWMAAPIAYSTPTLELLTALALVTELAPRAFGLIAAGLFTIFGAAVSINLLRGRSQIECGCFGTSPDEHGLSWSLVARNLMLIAASLVGAYELNLSGLPVPAARFAETSKHAHAQNLPAMAGALLTTTVCGLGGLLIRMKRRVDLMNQVNHNAV